MAQSQTPQVWGMRMRQKETPKGEDYAEDGFLGGFVALGGWKVEYGDPNSHNLLLEEIERKEDWSHGQITRFVKSVRKGDLFLLAKKDVSFLYVGTISGERPFVADTKPTPLRLRWKVDWIRNLKYAKENLLGLGGFGQGSLIRKEHLVPYVEDIKGGRKIHIIQIRYDENNGNEAVKEIKERIKILPPSYFEELVVFIAKEMGLQTEFNPKIGSADGGLDARGWRTKGLFVDNPKETSENFCIQVKQGAVNESIIKSLKENFRTNNDLGIIVTGTDSKLKETKPELFEDGRITLIDGERVSKYVLQLRKKLPIHIANIFNIVDSN